MAKVSISEAARLAGISRGSLYKSYLSKGVISVSKDSLGKKSIDTSELLRVFGELKGNSSEQHSGTQKSTDEQSLEQVETAKDIEIKMLREQISELKADKTFYQAQVTELTGTIKLLEAPRHSASTYPRLWWQFWK